MTDNHGLDNRAARFSPCCCGFPLIRTKRLADVLRKSQLNPSGDVKVMSTENSGDAALNILLDELEIRAQQQHKSEHADGYWVCQRRHPRNPFRSACNVRFFPQ